MGVEVRRATRDDIPALAVLQQQVAGELKWIAARPGVDLAEVEAWYETVLAAERRAVFVVPSERGVDAMLSIEAAPYGVADFGMFVRDTERGKGLGAALLETAIGWAREQGSHKVSLECWPHNTAAIALYKKFGFVEEGRKRRHYRRGGGDAAWDSVIMGLLLDPDIAGSPYGD